MGAATPAVLAATTIASAIMQGETTDAQLSAQKKSLEHERQQLLEQRNFLNEARDEEIDLFRREPQELLGLQTVGFAKAGVELSGSAINVFNQTQQDALEEEERIFAQYNRARTINELNEQGVSAGIDSVKYQKQLVPYTTLLSGATGAVTGYYTGQKLIN